MSPIPVIHSPAVIPFNLIRSGGSSIGPTKSFLSYDRDREAPLSHRTGNDCLFSKFPKRARGSTRLWHGSCCEWHRMCCKRDSVASAHMDLDWRDSKGFVQNQDDFCLSSTDDHFASIDCSGIVDFILWFRVGLGPVPVWKS
jgi:hypothetical protein